MKNKDVQDRIKAILSGENYVLAVFYNGSYVVGTDTPQSDVDFTVIVKSKKGISKAITLLKKNTRFIEIDHDVHFFSVVVESCKRVGVCVFDKKTMDFFVKAVGRDKNMLLKWQPVVQHKIVEAVPIYDPKNLLGAYQGRVAKIPEKIFKSVFSDSMDSLEKLQGYWVNDGFRNEFNFSHDLQEIIEKICLAIYARNGRLFMLPYKRLHKDLKELKPDIEKEMYFLVKGSNSRKNIEEKRLVLKKIIQKLER